MATADHGEKIPLLSRGRKESRRHGGASCPEIGQERRTKRATTSGVLALVVVATVLIVVALAVSRQSDHNADSSVKGQGQYKENLVEIAGGSTEPSPSNAYLYHPYHDFDASFNEAEHGLSSTDLQAHRVSIGGSREDIESPNLNDHESARGGGSKDTPIEMLDDAPASFDQNGRKSPARPYEGGGGVSTTKPNIFFFLIDDMGWGDMGYQSTDFSKLTPNLDALAGQGIKLSNYYSMHICTPARASLMTGRYPVRYGMQYFIILPGAPWSLPRNEKLMPQYLNDAGYESHMVGKWHVGSYRHETLPQARGFETFLGYLHGEENYWTHESVESSLDGRYFFDFGYGNETGYFDVATSPHEVPDSKVVDELWDASVAGMAGVASSKLRGSTGKPSAAMDESFVTSSIGRDWEAEPMEERTSVLDEGSKAYVGVYSEDVFSARFRRIVKGKDPWDENPLFLYMAHQSVHSPLGKPPVESFTTEERERLEKLNTTSSKRIELATTLVYLDKKFGELISELEEQGWMENSVIVVASDNGACFDDGGTNYPLRGGKQSVFEGGTKVPAFVYSKSHIPQELWGTTHDGVVHVTDWVPTFASLAGSEIYGSAGALDGVDQWAALTDTTGQTEEPRVEMLYNWDQYILSSSHGLKRCDDRTQGAFRQGNWKFITNGWCSTYNSYDPEVLKHDILLESDALCGNKGGCEDCSDACQKSTDYKFGDWLFDLEADPRETTNLIHEYPEIAEALRKRAKEVVYEDCRGSLLKTVNKDSYEIWARHGWWMMPWFEEYMGIGQGEEPISAEGALVD